MAVETFATDRLTAERLRAEHFDDLCRLHRDPEVMATLGGVRSDETTRAFLAMEIAHWETYGFGIYHLCDRASGAFAGRAGIRHVDVEGADEIELAYAFLAPFWGRGLATEIGAALLDVARRHGIGELVCFTRTTNFASRRVMEKVGFRYQRDFLRYGDPHVLFRWTPPDARMMRLAIEKARDGIARGQSPFGACIARGEEVVSVEHNVVLQTTDITAHAEVHAIRSATAKLGTIDLAGCTIYSTGEPCPMCFGACHWSHLDRIVFGTSIADAAAIGFQELSIPSRELRSMGGSPIAVEGGFLAEECRALFAEWTRRGEKKTY